MVGPLLERLAKAGRIGKADPLGHLIDAHVRVLEQLGGERAAHLVDDGLIGQVLIGKPAVEGSERQTELGGDLGGGRKSAGAIEARRTDPAHELGFAGTLAALASLDGAANGRNPVAAVLDKSGNVFGIASSGGVNNKGSVFEWVAVTALAHVTRGP